MTICKIEFDNNELLKIDFRVPAASERQVRRYNVGYELSEVAILLDGKMNKELKPRGSSQSVKVE